MPHYSTKDQLYFVMLQTISKSIPITRD